MVPSQLPKVFWSYSHHDLRMRCQLYVGEKQTLVNQGYTLLGHLLSQWFGGSGEEAKPKAQVPNSVEELRAKLQRMSG